MGERMKKWENAEIAAVLVKNAAPAQAVDKGWN